MPARPVTAPPAGDLRKRIVKSPDNNNISGRRINGVIFLVSFSNTLIFYSLFKIISFYYLASAPLFCTCLILFPIGGVLALIVYPADIVGFSRSITHLAFATLLSITIFILLPALPVEFPPHPAEVVNRSSIAVLIALFPFFLLYGASEFTAYAVGMKKSRNFFAAYSNILTGSALAFLAAFFFSKYSECSQCC